MSSWLFLQLSELKIMAEKMLISSDYYQDAHRSYVGLLRFL